MQSVDEENLQVTVSELGQMFDDTGGPLQQLLDDGGTFIDEAAAHTDETIALLDDGGIVLQTQQENSENIASFSEDLRLLTQALADSDKDLRGVLQGTPGTAREVKALLEDLEPTLPILLGNAISINQVAVSHLNGLEQLLVSYPRVIGARPERQHRRRLRPRQPAVRQLSGLHRRLPQPEGVAPVQRPHRRADLPGEVQQPEAVQPARLEVLARHPAQLQPRSRGRRQLRPDDRAAVRRCRLRGCPGQVRRPGQPVDLRGRLVEVAARGPGVIVPPMTSRNRPVLVAVALYVPAVLLVCTCITLGVLAVMERPDRSDAKRSQERYGAVLASASAETEAFINIDYKTAQESIDKVAAGATGEFKKQYTDSVDSVIEVLQQNESVMDGKVVWAGVVSVDADSSRVIAATSGTVANKATKGEPVARNFRIQLDLELVDGEWLTSNLEFVG